MPMKTFYLGWILLVCCLSAGLAAQELSYDELTDLSREHLEQAKAGNPHSQLIISNAYAYGWGVPVNFKLSNRWLKTSLDRGYPLAFHEMGIRHFSGLGRPANVGQGIHFLKLAIDHEIQESIVALGAYYLGIESKTGPIDVKLSKQYLLQAVKLNNSDAMLLLGLMYQQGIEPEANIGDDLNIDKAIYWFEKSAEHLNIFAIANLGLMYWHPCYQNIDYKKAYFWFKIAKLAGSTEWSQQRIESELNLSKATRNKMGFEAEDWFNSHNKDQSPFNHSL
jgi:uncharacterized protein